MSESRIILFFYLKKMVDELSTIVAYIMVQLWFLLALQNLSPEFQLPWASPAQQQSGCVNEDIRPESNISHTTRVNLWILQVVLERLGIVLDATQDFLNHRVLKRMRSIRTQRMRNRSKPKKPTFKMFRISGSACAWRMRSSSRLPADIWTVIITLLNPSRQSWWFGS